MSVFVLVHGAFHGGWCWDRVATRLRAAGHDVFTPSMIGMAENHHCLSPDIGLDTHVTGIANLLMMEGLSDVILVGHSYGGMVAGGVAMRAADRLAHVAVLDGAAPQNGDSMNDLIPAAAAAGYLDRLKDGLMMPPDDPFGITDARDAAWLTERLTPQPANTFSDAIEMDDAAFAAMPKTFIRCVWPGVDRPHSVSSKRAEAAADWRYFELPACHDAMVTIPDEVTEILLDCITTA
jgi:pimeloyl-ACP methyl ester carboxylesterase